MKYISSRICGFCCLYFSYLIERMNYFDANLKMSFGQLIMPMNVFGKSSSSHDNGKENDTSLVVQKAYLRTIYIESKIKNIHSTNSFLIRKLPCTKKLQMLSANHMLIWSK